MTRCVQDRVNPSPNRSDRSTLPLFQTSYHLSQPPLKQSMSQRMLTNLVKDWTQTLPIAPEICHLPAQMDVHDSLCRANAQNIVHSRIGAFLCFWPLIVSMYIIVYAKKKSMYIYIYKIVLETFV